MGNDLSDVCGCLGCMFIFMIGAMAILMLVAPGGNFDWSIGTIAVTILLFVIIIGICLFLWKLFTD
jgi:hypothetical protein